jgi:hypothetical protein
MVPMQIWIALLVALLPLQPSLAENAPLDSSEEITPQEKKAAEELLFDTQYMKQLLARLKKDNVRWFFMTYRNKDKIVFEFRDKREDMDHYPFICRLAVNLQTKECFEQGNDDERIH